MGKIFTPLWVFLVTSFCAHAQLSKTVYTENFDGNSVNYSIASTPGGTWKVNKKYYVSTPNAFLGTVPNLVGDTAVLTTPIYDFTQYEYVQLRFSHICKVSPRDIARVEYRVAMGGGTMSPWESLPWDTYLGKAANYRMYGFNANSYPEWTGKDSLAFPAPSWWKEEVFDLWFEAGWQVVQFRFIITHGATPATQVSYGWLIDNVEITGASYDLNPPVVQFTSLYPKDTVYTSGPYEIHAKVKTTTTANIENPWLKYTSIFNGVSTTDSILMKRTSGDSLWKATIPQFVEGTSVVYSITGKDATGNHATIMCGYYIKKPPVGGAAGYVVVGNGTSTSYSTPMNSYYGHSWSRQLYLASELSGTSLGGLVTKLAWQYQGSDSWSLNNQTCYFRAVDDTQLATGYIDPAQTDATLVWNGTYSVSGAKWYEIDLNKPFFLPPGKNLLVYWVHKNGMPYPGSSNSYFYHTQTPNNMTIYAQEDNNFPTGAGTASTNRPNARFYIAGVPNVDNSVALTSINSPLRGQTSGGVSYPVNITFRNKGDSALNSVTINWAVNGVVKTPFQWSRKTLPWDFEDSVTIGSYTPRFEQFDTITVWVSMPNGMKDTATYDDTLSVIIYGCVPNMLGTYTIGINGDFSSLKAAIDVLGLCTPLGGNITFELEPGTYTEGINLTDLRRILGNNILTITSSTYNAEDVIIKPSSGAGILLSNSNNIIIKHITVDQTDSISSYCLQFMGACNNITIRNCRLLRDTATEVYSNYVVYANNINGLNGISFINNLIDGGYYGIYLYGGSMANMIRNVVIDSNVVQNQYQYAIYPYYYVDCRSVSHNTVYTRSVKAGNNWYGIYTYYTHVDNIIGNRIIQRSNSIGYPYALYLYYQTNISQNSQLVANNEFRISPQEASNIIYIYNAKADLINNSIYGKGKGAARGICIGNSASNELVIKNNNIIMEDSSAYPIYLEGTDYLTKLNLDYNNMYAPRYIGYAGDVMTSFAEWRQTVTSDAHSVRLRPGFVDSTVNLRLLDYTSLECLKDASISLDIDNRIRTGVITTMGCYHGIPPYAVNATLMNITGNSEGLIIGGKDSIKVELINSGSTTLTEATIQWKWNNIRQPDKVWTGSLPTEAKAVITLGAITHVAAGYYTIDAWIGNLGTSLNDNYPADDTTSKTGYVCSNPMSGVYSLGKTIPGSDFTSFREFRERLFLCSADGDVTLQVQSGTYTENINLTDVSQALNGHKLTITSITGNASDVIVVTKGVGITLSNSNNILIKAITVDATQGMYSVYISGPCTNVVVRDNRLLNSTTTNTTAISGYVIYKPSGTLGDSISIINNLIDGGYYGIYFYGGTSNSAYVNNTVIDSNTIQNSYYYGLYSYYTGYKGLSHNTILGRTSSTSSYWYAMYMYYNNADIIGNRINQRNTISTGTYGILSYYLNQYNTSDTALVANNEIILSMTTTYYGIGTGYSRAKILHNSIYINGSGAARGIYVQDANTNLLIIKNNNIIMESPAAYPVYLSAITNVTLCDLNYNNMYAPNYVGYAGSNKLTIADWRQAVSSDRNSVSHNVSFKNKATNLELINPYGITCPPILTSVPEDINGQPRNGNITAMGCYHGFSATDTTNATLVEIVGCREGTILGQSDIAKVILINMGSTRIYSATVAWSYNGSPETTVSWAGNLGKAEGDTITLGQISYLASGDYTLVARIATLGGGLIDQNPYDDTAHISGYICSGPIAGGTYKVAKTGGHFASVDDAIKRFQLCGVAGNIILELVSGTYTHIGRGIDLSDPRSVFTNYTLTITSEKHNADSVVLKTDAFGIKLSNTNNLTVKDLTIDAKEGTYAVHFTGPCTNIVIRDCKLLNSTTTNNANVSGYVIYQTSGTGIISNVSIIKNIIEGGYSGIYLYGASSSACNTAIIVDSNTILNQYYQGIYSYYTSSNSISYNTILGRTSNLNSYWYAISMSYGNHKTISCNWINQRHKSTGGGQGISANYINQDITEKTLVANNEIIISMLYSYYGIGMSGSKSDIMYNSVYAKCSDNDGYGIYVYDYNNVADHSIIGNNIVMENKGYPIYLTSATKYNQWNIHGNNMHAPAYVGYIDGAISTLEEWQEYIVSDSNSINIRPHFMDSSRNLQLLDYTDFYCSRSPIVPKDINNIYRSNDTTTMGCYHGKAPLAVNAALENLTQLRDGIILSQTEAIEVTLVNTGTTTLTEANIHLEFNGVSRTVPWTGSLSTNQKAKISLGTITYNSAGNNILVAWIQNLGQLNDEFSLDDTVSTSSYICSLPLTGAYTVGNGQNFTSPQEFINVLSICGASGNITLKVLPGTYQGTLDLSSIASKMGNYAFTLASSTNKAEDVIIKTKAAGIILGGNNNVLIKDITVDAVNGTYGIYILGPCTNLVIRDNRLLNSTTTTSTSISGYVIYKPSGTWGDRISIINNLIDGGYYGICFYGGNSNTNPYATNIVIDSNTIQNNYYYGLYSYYTDYTSISHNIILGRTSSVSPYWYAMNGYYNNGNIIGNRISQRNTVGTGYAYGISFSYTNMYNTRDTAFIANNEIMLSYMNDYGILISYSLAKVLHNSIYVKSSSTAYGIYAYDASTTQLTIKKNNIVMESESANAFPIYLSGLSTGSYDIDNNNMYAPTYIGYAGSNITTMSMWQQTVPTDRNSVQVLPNFLDADKTLDLLDSIGISCASSMVTDDIMGIPRSQNTTIGAYHFFNRQTDVSPHAFISLGEVYSSNASVPLTVQIKNEGLSILTSTVINWVYNGSTHSYTWNGTLAPNTISNPISLANLSISRKKNDLVLYTTLPNGIADTRTLNDSLYKTIYACDGAMSGVYTIGQGQAITDLQTGLELLEYCGMSAAVTFKIEPVVYTQGIDLSNKLYPYTLTITSSNGNAEDVVIKTTGTGILLSNTSNVIIKGITIDATEGMYAVHFAGPCTNIVIRDNRLLHNPTTTATSYVVYKPTGTGGDNISIINNLIDGGYCGIYFYGGSSTSSYISNVVIDSNIIQNSYNYGLYLYYTNFKSIAYNTILGRRLGGYGYWIGMSIYYSNIDNMIVNRINQRAKAAYGGRAFYCYYVNYYNTIDRAFIANNEFISTMQEAYYGNYFYNTRADFLHNSIYVKGNGEYGASGIHIYNTAGNFLTIKNNNIIVDSKDAGYPIYLNNGTSYLNQCDIDYNNLYNSKYVGYAGSAVSTFAKWRETVITDSNSIRVLPVFVDISTCLKLMDTMMLLCPRDERIQADIQGYPRLSVTNMGAYHIAPKALDAMALDISFPALHVMNTPSYPSLTIQNVGKTPITSLSVVSANNGTLKSLVTRTGISLLPLEKVEISLDTIIPQLGYNSISAWITDVNGTGLDSLQINDTLHMDIYACTAPLSGVYTIPGMEFTTIEDFIFAATHCGANGPITVKFADGIHRGHLDLASASASLGGYPLVITSENGDTSLCRIEALRGMPAVTLGGNTNVTIQNLTINTRANATDTIGGTHGIVFTSGCDNVIIKECAVYADNSSPTMAKCGIFKKENTGISNNIRLTNNLIDGGYAGIWFYGGTGIQYGTTLTVDSNIVRNQYYYGSYLKFMDGMNIRYNTILSKDLNSSTTWYALCMTNNNGNVVGNKIIQRGTVITMPYGIYVDNQNQRLTSNAGLIANNEVRVRATDSYHGIYVANSHVDIVHNSINVTGSSSPRGINIVHSANNIITVKNNNIVMESSSAYPVYINSVSNMSLYDIDYNNMYAPRYIGYAGENISTLTAWRSKVPTDKYSVSVQPHFADATTSLKLADYAYLMCPLLFQVPVTIDGKNRQKTTGMGAYTHEDASFDLMLHDITYLPQEVVKGQRVPVSVKAINLGNTAITSAVFGWSINGVPYPSVTWTATTALNAYDDTEISIGIGIVPSSDMTVKVWVENLNNTGVPDPVKWNDTVKGYSKIIPLAWYSEPFLKDTITTLSFPVYAVIREETGALNVTTPTLNVSTIVGDQILHSNFPMTYENGLWKGEITNQYYGSQVIYALTVSDTVGNVIIITDSVRIKYKPGSGIYNNYNLSIFSLDGFETSTLCSPDYATISVSIANTGVHDYNFANNNVSISLRVTEPITFSFDTLVKAGTLLSGEIARIELTKVFPIMIAGQYKMKASIFSSPDVIRYDDTLVSYFISGRFGLPIDEDFSSGIPMIFEFLPGNTSTRWKSMSQGISKDTVVKPVYGTQMLSFHGSRGTMVQMRTRQLDLSATLSPALDLWYFHDTVYSEDYTDVRITIDGGLTYTTILSLTKYGPVYGWKRYTVDLPPFAVNQCVKLLFEAMEKSENSDVTQYIDRIRITAKQDIAVADIFPTKISPCDLQNKEWKVVLKNLTDPVLDFASNPTTITLEITGATNQVFTKLLQTKSMAGFTSDTFVLASNFNFAPGTYTAKAYITALPEDNNHINDTITLSFVISPSLSVRVHQISTTGACLAGEAKAWQEVTIENTGNMDLSGIQLVLSIDTGSVISAHYYTLKEMLPGTLTVGQSIRHSFVGNYIVPWSADYQLQVVAYLGCDSIMVHSEASVQECVDMKDLYVADISNPSGNTDKIGDLINISAVLSNRSDMYDFSGIKINARIENSQGVKLDEYTEPCSYIGTLSTVPHPFTKQYTVPNDSVYYIMVFVSSGTGSPLDNYPHNDTLRIKRTTDYVDIMPIERISISMDQNIPNPSTNSTMIGYRIPQSGEVIFRIHSMNGQILYSKVIESEPGDQSIEINTSGLSSGIYMYSMEYKGQRIVKRMSIKR